MPVIEHHKKPLKKVLRIQMIPVNYAFVQVEGINEINRTFLRKSIVEVITFGPQISAKKQVDNDIICMDSGSDTVINIQFIITANTIWISLQKLQLSEFTFEIKRIYLLVLHRLYDLYALDYVHVSLFDVIFGSYLIWFFVHIEWFYSTLSYICIGLILLKFRAGKYIG